MCRVKRYIVFLWLACASLCTWAQGQPFLCELGIQGGIGYYVGDGAHHIFMNPREAYGIHFRYKFTKRWALQVKASGQRITGYEYEFTTGALPKRLDTKWTNQLVNVDIMAEFNFFRFGDANTYDKRIKPYTPYIFLGFGGGVGGIGRKGSAVYALGYMPLGIGFKWKFAERCGLNIAWQHNIYFSDNLETQEELNDRFEMNGWNWMNCDLTGMMTIGIVFEFARAPKACQICNW